MAIYSRNNKEMELVKHKKLKLINGVNKSFRASPQVQGSRAVLAAWSHRPILIQRWSPNHDKLGFCPFVRHRFVCLWNAEEDAPLFALPVLRCFLIHVPFFHKSAISFSVLNSCDVLYFDWFRLFLFSALGILFSSFSFVASTSFPLFCETPILLNSLKFNPGKLHFLTP